MAEGHVVRHNAERFTRALAGKPLVRAFWRSRRVVGITPEELVGARVMRVDFAGKNHLFRLDRPSRRTPARGRKGPSKESKAAGRPLGTFRVHLMMFGSTQCGPPHLALRKPEPRVRFLLEAADARVVVFSAPVVEYYPEGTPIPVLDTLGPDALKEPFDAADFKARLRRAPHATLAEALLDPTVVAGVGNVYKSEALWRAGLHPERVPGSLTPAEARRLAKEVPRMMLEAYEALRSGENMRLHRHVYHRSRQPCVRCGTALAYANTGGRRTFWCPSCQPAVVSGSEPASGTQPGPARAARPVRTSARQG